jgi:TolA-binding protein
MMLRTRWYLPVFRAAAIASVALLLHACEPLDSDTQGDAQDESFGDEETPTKVADTPAPETAAPAGNLGTRVDSLSVVQQELVSKVDAIQSDVRDIKSSISQGQTTANLALATEYRRGLDLFYERKYQEGADAFRRLLMNEHPTPLQSNCHYWVGECEYGAGNYPAAIDAFTAVQQFSNSPKLDDAQMMLGMTYLRMGDKTRARHEFETLIEKHPDSEFVPRARRILATI